MSLTRNDIANMADVVAKALFDACAEEGEAWGELEEGVRNEFRKGAYAAMGAHDAYLTTAGYRIVKLQKAKPKNKLILPERPALVRPGHA